MENLKQRAVQAAERFLRHRGYDVVDVGWKSPAGNIDIVARDGDDLVFVKVAARDGAAAGFPPSRNQGELRARRERASSAPAARGRRSPTSRRRARTRAPSGSTTLRSWPSDPTGR